MTATYIRKSFVLSCLGGVALLLLFAAGATAAAPEAGQASARVQPSLQAAAGQAPFSSPTEMLPAQPFVTGVVPDNFGPGPGAQPGVTFKVREAAPSANEAQPGATLRVREAAPSANEAQPEAQAPFSSPTELLPAQPFVTGVVLEGFGPRQ